MKITLMNYDNKKADIEIPDTGLISIYISVISGDEIAIVSCLYKATWSDEKKAEKMATFNNRANSYDWD